MKGDLVKIVARLYTLMDELEDSNTHQKLELEETIDDLERMILDDVQEKDLEVEIEKAKWVCSICGKSSWETGWDYIGSGTNHLGCELEVEIKQEKDYPYNTEFGDGKTKEEMENIDYKNMPDDEDSVELYPWHGKPHEEEK